MAGAKARVQRHAGDERQDTAGSGHGIALDDDRAVMERRVREKDGAQQLAAGPGHEFHPARGPVAQGHQSLEHDQRPGAGTGHLEHGQDNGVKSRLGHFLAPLGPEKTARAHRRQSLADVGLEQDDDDQEDGAEEVGQKPMQGIEAEQVGKVVDDQNQQKAVEHRGGPGAANQEQGLVEDESHGRDVQEIAPGQVEIVEKASHDGRVPRRKPAQPARAAARPRACLTAATSWTRCRRAPRPAHRAEATAVARVRSPTDRPRSAPKTDLLDSPR